MSLLGYINNGLNQSLNGIVTITDGNGTTISDGQITSKNMNVDTFTATNLSSNNLTVTGNLTLPNNSILDSYLTSNIPKIPTILLLRKKGGKKVSLVKTKERIVVRYENKKYKRNILIRKNKKYVKINNKYIRLI